jgi:DNA-binding LacI/PurR family transcriptional regulator
MVTIRDVALAAGVSVSTVSHALSGKRPISLATKERIFKAIGELGYEPNPAAKALRSSSSGVIGFFAHDITELFSNLIIQGAERIARERGAYLLFTSGVEFKDDIVGAIDFLRKRRVDGIIIAYGIRQGLRPDLLPFLKIPVVTVNTTIDKSLPSVQPDDFAAGKEAAVHLLSRGCRFPAVIAGPRTRLASEERSAGFKAALRERGLAFDEARQLVHGDFSAESGARCMDELLEKSPGIDALFCANDYMAAGAINRSQERGLSIPRDLKVVGFDNRDFSSFWPIPITTFELPLERMGAIGATMLFDLIDGLAPDPLKASLDSRLIVRRSS